MRVRRLRHSLAMLAVLLGGSHIIFGFMMYPKFDLDLFWFSGFGLAILVSALANYRPGHIWILRIQNTLMLGFIFTLLKLVPQPQVAVGCALFAALTALSFMKPDLAI